MATSPDADLNLWALQGMEAFKSKGLSETRPLDRKKEFESQSKFSKQTMNKKVSITLIKTKGG